MLPLIPARKEKTVALQWSVTGHTNNALGQALCQVEVGQYKLCFFVYALFCFCIFVLPFLS